MQAGLAKTPLSTREARRVRGLEKMASQAILPEESGIGSLQHSCLEESMDRGARLTTVHGVEKSWTCCC